MASTTAKLLLLLLGEDRTASKALKGVGSQADKTSTTLGKAQKALKGFLAATAVTAAVKGLGDLVEAGEKASTSNARLEQVMRSMGHTTDDAAQAQLAYADELARTTGVDQNVIKLTQAKLATFKSLSSEVGLQEGIFKRATNAAVDLAATGFGTAESNAAQLGKALQDPVKGLTSLAKAGVTFTDQQKDQIKALVQSGKTLDAQKVVLAAIESQVGGVAEATANASDKYNVAVSQMQEAIGQRLLPAFENLTQAGINLTDAISDNSSSFGTAIDLATGLSAALNDLTGAASDSGSALAQVFSILDQLSGMQSIRDAANLYTEWSDAQKDATGEAKANTSATIANTSAVRTNTGANEDNATSLNEIFDARLKLRGDRRSLEAAFDDATAAVKENGKTLDINTAKGRANQAALDGIVAAAEKVPGRMQRARTKFIETAVAMGMTRKAARQAADDLGLIPKKAKEAANKLDDLKRKAKQLDGTKIRFVVSASMNRAADEIVYSVKGGGSMKFTAKAGGGYAPPGWVLRGENGPELTRETGSTYTKTAGSTRMAMGGGGQPVYITINAGLGSDPVAVGNGVVKALKAAQAAQSGRPFDIKTR